MPDRKIDTTKTPTEKKKPASPDSVVKGDKTGKAELTEDQLKDVSGGSFSWGVPQT